eukprot:XP_011453975.2 PREDICTED: uncharacterized protein LOC105346907 [Crassostrea gigas]
MPEAMAEETTNSNAMMESSYSSAVGGVRTSTSSTGLEEQFPLHRANKNFNVSVSSEYLFRELTSLVPVSLDSDDEEPSAHNEEIVNSFKVTSKDKDTLLPSPKRYGLHGNKYKLRRFFGNIFSKKNSSLAKENPDIQNCRKELAKDMPREHNDFRSEGESSTDKDFLFASEGKQKKSSAKRSSAIIFSCFRKL